MNTAPSRKKTYHGRSEGTAVDAVAIWVEPAEGAPYPLPHAVRHSPTGMRWGYAGSGRADLARSLLADYLGFVPSPAVYQEFKREYVARWPEEQPWRISSDELAAFLAQPRIRAALAADQAGRGQP